MKKLYLTSLVLPILPLCAISCANIKNIKDTSIDFPKKQRKEYYRNESISLLLDFFAKNNLNEKNIYIFQQENKSDSKFNELKYAFVYDPVFIQNSVHKNQDYRPLALTSMQVIKNTLSNDWYWTLNNLSKFKYIFNPYGDRYKTFAKEQEYFNEVRKKFNSLSISVQDNTPKKLIKMPFKDIPELKKYNVFTDKEIVYLLFDNNKVIKIWKFIDKGIPKLLIVPDILIFKNEMNIEDQLKQLEEKIFEKRVKTFKSNLESAKEDAELENEPFDEKTFIKPYIDEKYIEFHAIYQYNDDLADVLNEINKEELKIFKFTMRFIDEKN
ncbi:aromatic motif membrane protein [Mycoplasma sp. 1781]